MALTVLPTRVGYQPYPSPQAAEGRVGATAGQPAIGERFRTHLIASPFGTIHAATFRFPQPVGTGMPANASLHVAAYTAANDVNGELARTLPTAATTDLQTTSSRQGSLPEINRTLKGSRLVPRIRPDFDSPLPSTTDGLALPPGPQPIGHPPPAAGAMDEVMADRTEATGAAPPPDDADSAYFDPSDPENAEPSLIYSERAAVRAAHFYFWTAPLGGTPATLEHWGPGQAPVFEPQEPETAAPHEVAPLELPRNETLAPKGEVTGEDHRPQSPAERLGLIGAARAKQEKCLANAIYFEARGEPVRGQMAVAQVVINRVFSGYYPRTVCGVVYQNARRHLACQFTFACDGIPDRINEPSAWERAKHIAREALDGNFWLNDIGKATHYHARWVHPWWVREMRKLDRIGVHTFYRPRNWGDGSKSPIWGDAEATANAVSAL